MGRSVDEHVRQARPSSAERILGHSFSKSKTVQTVDLSVYKEENTHSRNEAPGPLHSLCHFHCNRLCLHWIPAIFTDQVRGSSTSLQSVAVKDLLRALVTFHPLEQRTYRPRQIWRNRCSEKRKFSSTLAEQQPLSDVIVRDPTPCTQNA